METEIVDTLDGAESLYGVWDGLAVKAGLPLCAPGWMLPWWRRMAPPASELRILALRDGGELVALAPWFAHRGEGARRDLRFLGAELSDRVDVLCASGREREAAAALREAILALGPDLVSFEAVPEGSLWTRELRGLRLARYENSVIVAPTVALPAGGEGFEGWMASRSGNFRSQMRRMRRRVADRGGRVRQIVDEGEIGPALDALLAMHADRWEGRADSRLTGPGVREWLGEAAAALGPDRLRLWAVELEGELISVQLFQAAGGEVKYWNGGWSEQHADVKPTMLTILAAIEDAIARGERRLDLGAGTHSYKMRFADGEDPLSWGGLIIRNRRWPRTRAELASRVLRFRAKRIARSLPDPVSRRLEGAARARRSPDRD
jgi:CelD/BcsL family acetyltransferase involved in cellulose biosynthesis